MDIDLSTGLDALIRAVDMLNDGAILLLVTGLPEIPIQQDASNANHVRSYNIVIKLHLEPL
jgi:hypothetical protein